LQAVDVAGVPPAVHARDEGNVLRPDEPAVYESTAALMSAVPEQQAGLVRVPRIATGADTATPNAAAASGVPAASAAPGAAASDGAAAAGGLSADELLSLQALDIRAGVVLECAMHPDAERYASNVNASCA
jgi:tRNA-binding EMAP/Myf-like protein